MSVNKEEIIKIWRTKLPSTRTISNNKFTRIDDMHVLTGTSVNEKQNVINVSESDIEGLCQLLFSFYLSLLYENCTWSVQKQVQKKGWSVSTHWKTDYWLLYQSLIPCWKMKSTQSKPNIRTWRMSRMYKHRIRWRGL